MNAVFFATKTKSIAAVPWGTMDSRHHFLGGMLAQRFLNNFFHVVGERWLIADAFQLIPYQLLPDCIIPSPLGERGEHSRGDLRVKGVEQEYLVAEEGVSCAINGVKLAVVGGTEGGNQGPHFVGIFVGE